MSNVAYIVTIARQRRTYGVIAPPEVWRRVCRTYTEVQTIIRDVMATDTAGDWDVSVRYPVTVVEEQE